MEELHKVCVSIHRYWTLKQLSIGLTAEEQSLLGRLQEQIEKHWG